MFNLYESNIHSSHTNCNLASCRVRLEFESICVNVCVVFFYYFGVCDGEKKIDLMD